MMQKREAYLENYWLTFLDFIEVFKELVFEDVPLPQLANFYQLLDHDLREEMSDPEFKKHLNSRILDMAHIQPQYEQWIKPLKMPIETKPGKTLLNYDYLRFSENNYIKYFDAKQTIIFARWKRKDYLGIPVHYINDYKVDVSESINSLLEKANILFKLVDKHPVFGNQYFRTSFLERIRHMVQFIAAVNRYLKENIISCVVVGTTEDLLSRVLTIIATYLGIPSICMQHGLLGGDEAYIPVFSTKVAVYGEYEKDWYLKRGLVEDRIAITGHPRFDDIFTQEHLPKEEFLKLYKLNPKKKTVLCATQPNYVKQWNELIDILAQNPLLEIVLKPHPWELSRKPESKLMDNYYELDNKYESVKLISKKGVNLYDILSNVDMVITNLSTVGLETVLAGKPLFMLSDREFDYYERLKDYTFTEPAELAKYLTKFIRYKKLQEIAKERGKEFLDYAYPQKLSGTF
ncbi:hypothetical protein N752_20025 [Desulforamulus aquiferis]|nr:hypothetical protein [Desulforamulus aquiferis]RYD03470.1 hypothetical protein N752_20025 [Desulforamulus aquiferis]